ncbi:MAG: hypothetical protein K0R93_3585 [Anaerosolibacter sp.]|nr:hypothetical protein [Anaerosolibacter sp.]
MGKVVKDDQIVHIGAVGSGDTIQGISWLNGIDDGFCWGFWDCQDLAYVDNIRIGNIVKNSNVRYGGIKLTGDAV